MSKIKSGKDDGNQSESNVLDGHFTKPASLSVVIPVFNERKTVREIISRVKRIKREKQIIIVDDCSNDGTRRILKEFEGDPDIILVFQSINRGKGSALREGFRHATKDIVVVQDADLEYNPQDFEMLLRPIERGRADVVYGSRFQHGERRVLYFWHAVGNRLLTTISNIFTDLNLSDMETCYKAFKREIIQNIRLVSDRFGFEPEVTAKVAKLGCAIYEVPIDYYGRSYQEGKKITWKDGVSALFHILRFSLSRKNFVIDEAAVRRVQVSPPPQSDVGVDTLEAFENAPRYNSWIFERFAPAVSGNVLEVGSGIGNIIAEIIRKSGVSSIVATDYSASALETIKERFGDDERLSCHVWDASKASPPELVEGRYDSIICSNVLEHIEDHDSALQNMRRLLSKDGKLILLVPAHQFLFCGLDQDLGHFRRYSKECLLGVLEKNGFHAHSVIDHNFVGALGWFWAGKIRKRRTMRRSDTRAFETLVPFLKPIDGLLSWPWGGVSLIAVASSKVASSSGNQPLSGSLLTSQSA